MWPRGRLARAWQSFVPPGGGEPEADANPCAVRSRGGHAATWASGPRLAELSSSRREVYDVRIASRAMAALVVICLVLCVLAFVGCKGKSGAPAPEETKNLSQDTVHKGMMMEKMGKKGGMGEKGAGSAGSGSATKAGGE